VEVRDLRALLAVVRCGSFTVAARQLGFTQSAVSQQVASLEAELGQLLVERRPVRPTAAGRRLAEHAAQVLLRLDVASSELARFRQRPGAVKVALSPLASPQLLAVALRSVRSQSPDLKVSVKSVVATEAINLLASGAVDAALVDGITGPSEPLHLSGTGLLTSRWVAQAPLVVALQRGHPLAARPEISLEVLADAPWLVAPALLEGGATRRHQGASWKEPVLYEGADLGTLLKLVGAGLGAALLPDWAVEGDDSVTGAPLSGARLVHRTELLTLRTDGAGQNPVIEAVLALSRRV